ncbi:hypothetical protein RZS08_04410, partial [Arthrospira platensis SPKY1]|nr:hypothetical protein [Arthrospira platensis SPKY1]
RTGSPHRYRCAPLPGPAQRRPHAASCVVVAGALSARRAALDGASQLCSNSRGRSSRPQWGFI